MPNSCPACEVSVGEVHESACDVETCALCGWQLMTCNCVYELSGMDPERLEQDHPAIYENGATSPMWERYDAEVQKVGGPVSWSGEWTGVPECVEFGWYARRNPDGPGWVRCEKDTPGARPDVNRLSHDARWDVALRRYVLR